jgi:hypothetical protein
MKKNVFLSRRRNFCFFSFIFFSFTIILYGVVTNIVLSPLETVVAWVFIACAGGSLFKLDILFFQLIARSLFKLSEWARYHRAKARRNRGLVPVYKKRRGAEF